MLEYEERKVPLVLFYLPCMLMIGFTAIFPILAIITLPIAAFIIFSIFNGDISIVDQDEKLDTTNTSEEE